MQTDASVQKKIQTILPLLDEKQKRMVLAAEAQSIGRGGISKVAVFSGMSRVTLHAGAKELSLVLKQDNSTITKRRIRKKGGGRKKKTDEDENIIKVVEAIVTPHTLGDPMKPLLWTSKSLRKISEAAKKQGYNISHKLVGIILKNMDYSLQSNRKTDEGSSHADRDAQFEHINDTALEFMSSNNPVISVDCKKKELIGNYKNAGTEWHAAKSPTNVKVYDFVDKELGKAVPYGVYDISNNESWVSVGVSHDTASFAVATIRKWWYEMGCEKFGLCEKLLITADGGGSNSSKSRLWKKELQLLADEIKKKITVIHFPPGTSKWNKIEHRLFSHITMNWREKPLTSLEVVVNLIANTTTTKGLKVRAALDKNIYPKGIVVTDEQLSKVNITKNNFHGEWNYVIEPQL